MPINKLIYRLDFEPNFDIIDSAGKILRIFQEQGKDEKTWPQLGDTIENRSVTGKNLSDENGLWYSITILPTSIIGQFESIEGINFVDIEKTKFFNDLTKTTNILRKEFKLTNFTRTGIRFYLFNPLSYELKEVHSGFNQMLSSFSQNFYETLGGIVDSGVQINGENDDGIRYNFRFGPYLKDFGKIIDYANKKPKIKQLVDSIEKDFKLTYDIDFFEKNKYLSETTNLKKWASPIIQRAFEAISIIESSVIKKIEER